jgi:hypothetical protein
VAVIVFCVVTQQFFIALLVAWYVWTSWTQWLIFRSHNRTD